MQDVPSVGLALTAPPIFALDALEKQKRLDDLQSMVARSAAKLDKIKRKPKRLEADIHKTSTKTSRVFRSVALLFIPKLEDILFVPKTTSSIFINKPFFVQTEYFYF